MCLEFDVESPGENKIFSQTFYKHFTNIYPKSCQQILKICSEKYLESNGKRGLMFSDDGEYVSLKCNKLKELADEYTQKSLIKKPKISGQTPDRCRDKLPPIDIDKDKELLLSSLTAEQARLVELLKSYILLNNPKAIINEKTWVDPCRLMFEKDKRTAYEVEAVINYCQNDDFWKSNILSMRSLRKQFDRLYVKMKGDKNARQVVRPMQKSGNQGGGTETFDDVLRTARMRRKAMADASGGDKAGDPSGHIEKHTIRDKGTEQIKDEIQGQQPDNQTM